jgi:translation initiation factor IF-2
MAVKMMRLSQVARKLNIGKNTIIEFLNSQGYEIEDNPNFKIGGEQLDLLSKEFADSALDKEEASSLSIGSKHSENVVINAETESAKPSAEEDEEEILIKGSQFESKPETAHKEEPAPKEETKATEEKKEEEKESPSDKPKLKGIKVVGKIDLEKKSKVEKKEEKPEEEPKEEKQKEVAEKKDEPKEEPIAEVEDTDSEAPSEETEDTVEPGKVDPVIEARAETLKGLKVVGKIDLPKKAEKPVASSDDSKEKKKKKRPRKRLQRDQQVKRGEQTQKGKKKERRRPPKEEPSEKEIQEQIKATLAKLSGGKSSTVSRSKYRREKRSAVAEAHEKELQKEQEESKVLKVSEFISTNDLASLMDVSVNDIISAFMSLGMFVSINQRLDAEAITIIADEFDYTVEFVNEEEESDVAIEKDKEETLEDRAPIVTIMGHVDHGKTSLLDYIRSSKITAGEAGGITQHIGAYDVTTDSGKRVAFLDTPGHEAFTAMRARGAKLTDIVVIVVAADDSVMPQTKEAINHALVADVPIIIAINKIDRPNANVDKIKEQLANINILVEDWGGKYQCQEISAKTGEGIDDLLEKVLLEAELLELKANPNKKAIGTVVEAELDKGRGYVTTVLVSGWNFEGWRCHFGWCASW